MFLLNAPAQRIAIGAGALPRNLAVVVSEAVKANNSDGGGHAPKQPAVRNSTQFQ